MKIVYLTILGIALLFGSSTLRTTPEGAVAAGSNPDGSRSLNSERIGSPPTSVEVKATLHRIFRDAVSSTAQEHSFTTGDFNGDGSPDLAALVLPVDAELKLLNDPLANWTVQDATQAFFPPANQPVVIMPPKPKAQSVRANEPLLAVIHGYGPSGWRDPNAQQAYLVRHAAHGRMESRPAPEHVEGGPASLKHADVIYESHDQLGFVFWTGSQYAWRAAPSDVVRTARTKPRD